MGENMLLVAFVISLAAIIVSVVKLRLHPFLSLLIGSLLMGFLSGIKLDKILELWDYLLSDEGSFLALYGPEGELYDMVDGNVELHDDSVVITDTYPSTEALGILARRNPSTYDSRFVSAYPKEYDEVNAELVAQAEEVTIPEYNQRCTQLVMELGLDFVVNFNEDFLNIMTGTQPVEEMWADTVAGYEADGLQDVITQVNEALAAE